jgi:hypothetical protein
MENSSSIDKRIVLLERRLPLPMSYRQYQIPNMMLLFGLFILCGGLFFTWGTIYLWNSNPASNKWDFGTLGCLASALICLGVGGMSFIWGYKGRKFHSPYLKLKEKEPGKPWLWDLPWDPKEIENGSGDISQYLRFRNSSLSFQQFPFWTGEKFSGKLQGIPENLQKLDLTLRFVVVQSGHSDQKVQYCQIYKNSKTVHKSRTGSGEIFTLEFDLPEGPEYQTQIGKGLYRYWELDVVGEMPFINYRGRFLLPVYSKVPPSEDQKNHFPGIISFS